MRKISSELDAKIIEMWFQGLSRDEIARILMVSQGKVSDIVNSLPTCLEPLRDLSKTLRKLNLLPTDALKGAKLLQLLAEQGTTPEQIPISLEIIKKTSTEAGYQPKEAIQASIKLANLEKQSCGKPYPETLKEFQTLTQQMPELKQEKSQLMLEIMENKEKRKQAFKKAKVTEKEIMRTNRLKSSLDYYGIDLFQVDQLLDYLSNMNDTGLNPRTFVSLTKKIGSIKRHISDLEEQKQIKIKAIDRANQQIELKTTELNQLQTSHDAFTTQAKKEKESVKQAIAEEDTKLQKAKSDVEAATSQLSNLKSAIQQAEQKQQEAINETEKILNIKNYALEHQQAIGALNAMRLSLEEQVNGLTVKIAIANVITDFLTTQSDFLFDQFYSEIQRIKKTRETPGSPLKPALQNLTEAMKIKVLQAINEKHFPVFNNLLNEHMQVLSENAQLKQKVASLEMENRERLSRNHDQTTTKNP